MRPSESGCYWWNGEGKASLPIGCRWEMGWSSEWSSQIPSSSRADARLPQGLALPFILSVCSIYRVLYVVISWLVVKHFHPGSWFSTTMWRAWSRHLRKLGQLGRPGGLRAWVTGTFSETAVVELRKPGIGHISCTETWVPFNMLPRITN